MTIAAIPNPRKCSRSSWIQELMIRVIIIGAMRKTIFRTWSVPLPITQPSGWREEAPPSGKRSQIISTAFPGHGRNLTPCDPKQQNEPGKDEKSNSSDSCSFHLCCVNIRRNNVFPFESRSAPQKVFLKTFFWQQKHHIFSYFLHSLINFCLFFTKNSIAFLPW